MVKEMVAMTARPTYTLSPTASARAGDVTLVLGLATVAATCFAFLLSLSDTVDPSHWIRVLALVWLPIGFFGAPVAYALARLGPGRANGRWGLALTGAALVAFVVLLLVAG